MFRGSIFLAQKCSGNEPVKTDVSGRYSDFDGNGGCAGFSPYFPLIRTAPEPDDTIIHLFSAFFRRIFNISSIRERVKKNINIMPGRDIMIVTGLQADQHQIKCGGNMGFLNVERTIIDLGTQRPYKLIQISDTHAVSLSPDQTGEELERAKQQENFWMKGKAHFAHLFGEKYDESECAIHSSECLQKEIEYINSEAPDAALLTGDMIDYPSGANDELLRRSIRCINTPVLFTCGNHERPADRYNDVCINGDASFQVIEFDDLRLVGLDDSRKTISRMQLEKLQKVTENDKKTVICMHIPVKTASNRDEMISYEDYYTIDSESCDSDSREFIKYISERETVRLVLCGHCHGASQSEFTPGKKQLICSSGLIGYIREIIIH